MIDDNPVSDTENTIAATTGCASGPDTRDAGEIESTYTDLSNYYTKLELSETH